MKRLIRQLHLYAYYMMLGLTFLFFYPLTWFFSRAPLNFHGMNGTRRIVSWFSAAITGMFFRKQEEVPIDWSEQYIICANHSSNLDITALIVLLKRNFVFMGKDELVRNLVTGIYFRTIDIPLNRASKMSAFRAFKRAGEVLDEGRNLVIFPEGMISSQYPPFLHPFKNGPFKLAIEKGLPILPVTICNAWDMMWDDGKKYGSRPGICDIYVHRPIATSGMKQEDADVLKDMVFLEIDRKWTSYRVENNLALN